MEGNQNIQHICIYRYKYVQNKEEILTIISVIISATSDIVGTDICK